MAPASPVKGLGADGAGRLQVIGNPADHIAARVKLAHCPQADKEMGTSNRGQRTRSRHCLLTLTRRRCLLTLTQTKKVLPANPNHGHDHTQEPEKKKHSVQQQIKIRIANVHSILTRRLLLLLEKYNYKKATNGRKRRGKPLHFLAEQGVGVALLFELPSDRPGDQPRLGR